MNPIELSKLDKLVKVSIDLLELASRLCPYAKDKDVACIVILFGWTLIGYPNGKTV